MFNSFGAVREPLKRHSHGCQTKNLMNEISFHCIRGGRTINSDKHFGTQKGLHDETVLLSRKNIRLK